MNALLQIGLRLGLAGALLTSWVQSGCRNSDTSDDTQDLGDNTPADLSMGKVAKPATIRDLNMPGGLVSLKDRVRVSGVVISPFMWKAYDDRDPKSQYCNFRVVLMQSDGSAPTLKDGITVTVGLKTTFAGDMSKLTQCDTVGKKSLLVMSMDALKSGDLVEVEGTLDSFGAAGSRFIDAYGGKVTSMGQAPMQPMPVPVADPTTFANGSPLPKAFVDSCSVLVRFDNVQVSTAPNTYQEYTVNTTDTGGASISSSYVRVLTKNYMAPPKGTMLKSVTGIVFGDYGGFVWPRTVDDIKM